MKRIEQRSKNKNEKTRQGMNQYEPHVWTISNMFKSCQDYSCERVAKACPLVGPSLNDEIDDASKFSAPNVHIPGNKTGTRREQDGNMRNLTCHGCHEVFLPMFDIFEASLKQSAANSSQVAFRQLFRRWRRMWSLPTLKDGSWSWSRRTARGKIHKHGWTHHGYVPKNL